MHRREVSCLYRTSVKFELLLADRLRGVGCWLAEVGVLNLATIQIEVVLQFDVHRGAARKLRVGPAC